MFRADLMPCAHNPALEQTESGLHSVCVNISVYVDMILVANCLMLRCGYACPVHCVRIGRKFISDQHIHIVRNILFDIACQCTALGIFGVEETQIATTL